MRFWFTLGLLLLALQAQAGEWSGKVVGVSDGDTITVMHDGVAERIRLADIDAPEKAQSFGNQSKMSLSGLCFGKQAQVETMTMDRYGRTVGRVRCDGVDANAEQIRRGMAWAYRQYLTDQSLLTMETEAKSARRGLWGDSDPVPPWDYRHGGKPSTANTAPGSDPNQYHLGPRGGCYTITNGETHYVSHSKCR